MSRTRQVAAVVERVTPARPVGGLVARWRHGERIAPHEHPVAQLVYAGSGVMAVSAAGGTWVVPPERAVWVPARVTHAIRMTGDVEMHTVYVHPRAVCERPPRCGVVHVSPLLRELVRRVLAFDGRWRRDGPEARLVAVLLDEIRAAPEAPLHLPLPSDPRALRVAQALLDDPADARALHRWTRVAAASQRTLARLFARETGMGFRAWRQQRRLLASLERLAAGDAVTTVALDLGYASPSAFVAMFRRAFGTTPGRYFAASGGGGR